ncbi:MBL fold metallo-hydrolase RNA specificity domain-containing protein [Pelomonas cellulosilytica]|uniref:MBL fold metallo-hydrolase n=1 Tax=Pelomonas cellulosilytica TaxID=2906762 RepID=A0ABS8XYC9_9BURK|nr:MBL fold metallo-hydrolase [Pelomonas sp. P8]MCE4557644.1 MBL fold metallo-hydrolase [Pelomonas sp. P8]
MKLTFLGAADTVTGSRHLLSLGDQRLLLDAGLFQGYKALRERNWMPLGVDAGQLDAVLLSHAHLDHCGYLPALRRQGFHGPIYATAATRDLCDVLLRDSAHLQEEDARRANRDGTSRHDKAMPLYGVREAEATLKQFAALPRDGRLRLGTTDVRFTPGGHLLGATSIHVSQGGRSLLFSGDVGRVGDLLMPPPQVPPAADVVLIESTYGNRLHPAEDAQARLAQILRATFKRGGSVLLPSFAVGRAQALLLLLQRLRNAGELPLDVPIWLDSPMAEQATELTVKHARLLRISASEARSLTDRVRYVTKQAQSLKLASSLAAPRARPAVVISASGMATGGRVLNYLETLAPDPRHHIAFPGFQAGGTRGARMVAGERQVKVRGRWIAVNAEISHLDGLSGHADADGLLQWLRALPRPPEQVYVVHGEPDAADALRGRIQDELGWSVRVPQQGETVTC